MTMHTDNLKNKCRGSLIGGAIGDALGYPVEFVNSFEEIKAKYDDNGIVEYDMSYPWLDRKFDEALFSDDTQMTLYTAEGLLRRRGTENHLSRLSAMPILYGLAIRSARK